MANGFVQGIDVSLHQGVVNWGAVSQAGIAFAFARATIGGHQTDSKFPANWGGIVKAGLTRGAYHYFWPLTAWQDQANNFINTVGPLQTGNLPPALDLEEAVVRNPQKHDAWDDVPSDQRVSMIQNWLDAVEQALGMKPMIYTRQNFIANLLGEAVQTLAENPLWIAHYNVQQPAFPPNWASWTLWQYTESGTVDGIDGNVDGDYFNGSLDDLRALTKS